MRAEKDNHHIVSPRKVHAGTYGEALYIRDALIARGFPRPIHEQLHANTAPIPLLGYHALRRVARDIQPYYEHVQDGIDDFCTAVEASNEHRSAKPMEIRLGELVIETMREQLPFINEGLPRKPKLYIVQGGVA